MPIFHGHLLAANFSVVCAGFPYMWIVVLQCCLHNGSWEKIHIFMCCVSFSGRQTSSVMVEISNYQSKMSLSEWHLSLMRSHWMHHNHYSQTEPACGLTDTWGMPARISFIWQHHTSKWRHLIISSPPGCH